MTDNPSNAANIVGDAPPGSHHETRGTTPLPDGRADPQTGSAASIPSPQIIGIMEREFPPCRADETDSQYENRYLAHDELTTQQSWSRGGYDNPPHLESVSSAIRGTGNAPNMGASAPVRRQAPMPGRMHPDAPGMARYRTEAIKAINKQPVDQRVQFRVLPDQRQVDDEPDDPQYQEGHHRISAYRVSQGPPTNGLWNSEHYHYAVMLKRIRKLIHWKIGVTLEQNSRRWVNRPSMLVTGTMTHSCSGSTNF